VLIDATHGVVEQTKRHSFIASLLSIPHVIVCINKMDLVDYSETIFNEIVEQCEAFSSKLLFKDIRFIPICALDGDNIVNRSKKMDWYQGAQLLHTLETLHVGSDINKVDARFPVQTILNVQHNDHPENRVLGGRIASGIFRKGDEITVLPSGDTSFIAHISTYDGELKEAFAPMSVSINLTDNLIVNRGDMIVRTGNKPQITTEIEVMLCWLNKSPADPKSNYFLQHTSNEQLGRISEIIYKYDVQTHSRSTKDKILGMNDIARVKLKVNQPIMIDSYRTNRTTGSIVLVDSITNDTVAAGMII